MNEPEIIPIGFERNIDQAIEAGDKVWIKQTKGWIGVQGSIGRKPSENLNAIYIKPIKPKAKQENTEWGTW